MVVVVEKGVRKKLKKEWSLNKTLKKLKPYGLLLSEGEARED